MRRRGVLVAASVALTGCLGGARDATGPRTPPTAPEGAGGASTPEPDLYLRSFDAEEDAGGDVSVVGTVANRGDARRTGTVEATVTAGDRTDAGSARVTVGAGGEEPFEIPLDVAYEAFASGGSLDVRVTG